MIFCSSYPADLWPPRQASTQLWALIAGTGFCMMGCCNIVVNLLPFCHILCQYLLLCVCDQCHHLPTKFDMSFLRVVFDYSWIHCCMYVLYQLWCVYVHAIKPIATFTYWCRCVSQPSALVLWSRWFKHALYLIRV